jgi:hypothetical protein
MYSALAAATNVYTRRKTTREGHPTSFKVDPTCSPPVNPLSPAPLVHVDDLPNGQRFVGDGFQLPPVTSAKDLWDCWHGKGMHEDIPIEGGVAALDKSRGKKWRQSNTETKNRMYNRYRAAIECMQEEKVGYTDDAVFFKEMNIIFTRISPFSELMKKRSKDRAGRGCCDGGRDSQSAHKRQQEYKLQEALRNHNNRKREQARKRRESGARWEAATPQRRDAKMRRHQQVNKKKQANTFQEEEAAAKSNGCAAGCFCQTPLQPFSRVTHKCKTCKKQIHGSQCTKAYVENGPFIVTSVGFLILMCASIWLTRVMS